MWRSILQLEYGEHLLSLAVSRIHLTKVGQEVLLYLLIIISTLQLNHDFDRILSSYADIILRETVTTVSLLSRSKSDCKPCKWMSDKRECQDTEIAYHCLVVFLTIYVQKPWQVLMHAILGQYIFLNVLSQFWNSKKVIQPGWCPNLKSLFMYVIFFEHFSQYTPYHAYNTQDHNWCRK